MPGYWGIAAMMTFFFIRFMYHMEKGITHMEQDEKAEGREDRIHELEEWHRRWDREHGEEIKITDQPKP